MTQQPSIKVYGADWCPLTRRALQHLQKLGVEFQYIDVEQDPQASEWVRSQNDGKEKKPTIEIDGRVFTELTNAELDTALASPAR